jgi:hypothetical protein
MNRFLQPNVYLPSFVLFFALLSIAFFNRISIDDMFFYSRCRDMGIKNMVSEQYYGYSGRYAAYFLNGLVLSCFNHSLLVLWNIFSILAFFVAVQKFIHSVKIFPVTHSAGWIFIFAALIFGSSHPGEEFFWYTQVNTYLWSSIFLLTCLSIITEDKKSITHYILLVISCVFIGGSSESICIQSIMLIIIFIILKFKQKKKTDIYAPVIALIVLLCAGYFTLFSPGNQVRSEIISKLTNHSFPYAMASSLYHYFTGINNIERFVWLALLVIPATVFFSEAKNQLSLIKASILYFILLSLFMLPSAWALREPAPARALITSDILTVLYVFFCAIKLKKYFQIYLRLAFVWAVITLLAASFIYVNQSYNYSMAYDKREKIIENHSTEKIITINQTMPYCRVLKVAEITSDLKHYTNKHFRLYYQKEAVIRN